MFSTYYDSFLFPRTRVIVVSEERLREVERAQKQQEIDTVEKQLGNLEAHLEALKGEFAALPAAKEEVAA